MKQVNKCVFTTTSSMHFHVCLLSNDISFSPSIHLRSASWSFCSIFLVSLLLMVLLNQLIVYCTSCLFYFLPLVSVSTCNYFDWHSICGRIQVLYQLQRLQLSGIGWWFSLGFVMQLSWCLLLEVIWLSFGLEVIMEERDLIYTFEGV
jgi:hypothetical protein